MLNNTSGAAAPQSGRAHGGRERPGCAFVLGRGTSKFREALPLSPCISLSAAPEGAGWADLGRFGTWGPSGIPLWGRGAPFILEARAGAPGTQWTRGGARGREAGPPVLSFRGTNCQGSPGALSPHISSRDQAWGVDTGEGRLPRLGKGEGPPRAAWGGCKPVALGLGRGSPDLPSPTSPS